MGGMLRRASKSPSLVVAIIALVVAVGGTSYAQLQLPRNSVGARELKTGAVGSGEVKNRSLRVRDFRPGTRAALRGPAGERGPQGLPGGGAAGATATPIVRSLDANVGEDSKTSRSADCLAGERVTGGGADVKGGDTAVVESYPKPDGTGWWVTIENNNNPQENPGTGGPYPFTAYAICVQGGA